MAAKTDITLEGPPGAPRIDISVREESIHFDIKSSPSTVAFSSVSSTSLTDPVRNSIEAVGQLAGILKKDHAIDRTPDGDISLKISTPNGPDLALAVMATKLFHANGAISEDQVSRFEAQLKSAERTPEPVVAAAQEHPAKLGFSNQLESIRAAMSGVLSGMQEAGTALASAKKKGTPVVQVALNQGNLRTT